MTKEQLYDEAFRTMAEEPLEIDEPVGPRRGRKPNDGTGNRGGGKRLRNPNGRRIKFAITLDPDLALLIQWHAKARDISVSESINMLLGEALRSHEIDAASKEVL